MRPRNPAYGGPVLWWARLGVGAVLLLDTVLGLTVGGRFFLGASLVLGPLFVVVLLLTLLPLLWPRDPG